MKLATTKLPAAPQPEKKKPGVIVKTLTGAVVLCLLATISAAVGSGFMVGFEVAGKILDYLGG